MEHKDGYCCKCIQFREERDYSRHFLLRPTPLKMKCDFCYNAEDKLVNKMNRSNVAEAKAVKKVANSKIDPVFTAKRRKAEMFRELIQINKEHEL